MEQFSQVEVLPRSLDVLRHQCDGAADGVQRALDAGRRFLSGRTVWNINSTAKGGGVAELLANLLSFARGADIDARWGVVAGHEPFFRLTKRLHHALHGSAGDGAALDEAARDLYDDVMRRNAEAIRPHLRVGDVLVLHDPQTAGLIPRLLPLGCPIIWRCHIGIDEANEESMRGWRFLQPYLAGAHALVFSREAYIPPLLPRSRCVVITPSIDPGSPKNRAMSATTVRALAAQAGLIGGDADPVAARFEREDGSTSRLERRADVLRANGPPAPDVPIVVQVSRWDPLKDPVGVMAGFARLVAAGGAGRAELLLVGPQVDGVTDDPEGAETFAAVRARWLALPEAVRARVHLACLPMADAAENAAMVNAIQRHATVVVQKSLREGFGLTVTEAMWKGRALLASRVGGIQDQVVHDESGVLLADPHSHDEFATQLGALLGDPDRVARLGQAARTRVQQHFLPDRHLARYAELLERTTGSAASSGAEDAAADPS